MVLLSLIIILAILLYLNFEWSHRDVFHPAVVFNAVFLIFSLSCFILKETYLIRLHPDTMLVIVLGVAVFSIITFFSRFFDEKRQNLGTYQTIQLKEIKVSNVTVWLLIIIQLLTIFFFYRYIQDISVAHRGYVGSLTENISLYDTMTKFWTEIYQNLDVRLPIFYRMFNPVTEASFWIVLYIIVHNFLAVKKVNWLMVSSAMLQCLLIFLNGSRSPLFRVITFITVVYFVLWRKKNGYKIAYKYYLYLIGVVMVAAVGFIAMVFMMRKVTVDSLQNYFFTYVGAQIENLNNVIKNGFEYFNTELLGEQTFRNLYLYLGKLLNVNKWSYPSIDVFTFSQTGVEIGNVYTTFYAFMYDFGFMGVLLFTGGMSIYYVMTYEKVKRTTIKKFDYRLMIYAFLFNDLVMSAFSNRFYNTVFDGPFIKILLLSYPMYFIFVKHANFLMMDKKK